MNNLQIALLFVSCMLCCIVISVHMGMLCTVKHARVAHNACVVLFCERILKLYLMYCYHSDDCSHSFAHFVYQLCQ